MQTPWSICRPDEAPLTPEEKELYTSHPPAWQQGLAVSERESHPGTNSGVVAMLLGVAVLAALSLRHFKRMVENLLHELLSVRRRENAFDEHTVNEKQVVFLLLLQLFVAQGVLLYIWLAPTAGGVTPEASHVTRTVAALAGLAGCYYLFQLMACRTLGYVFTDKVNTILWQRGLNASQSVLSLTVVVPALLALFYPALSEWMLWGGAGLYVLSRICYIIKGFRIFYTNFPSLLYFILYLCTLEIVPVIFSCVLAREICVILI